MRPLRSKQEPWWDPWPVKSGENEYYMCNRTFFFFKNKHSSQEHIFCTLTWVHPSSLPHHLHPCQSRRYRPERPPGHFAFWCRLRYQHSLYMGKAARGGRKTKQNMLAILKTLPTEHKTSITTIPLPKILGHYVNENSLQMFENNLNPNLNILKIVEGQHKSWSWNVCDFRINEEKIYWGNHGTWIHIYIYFTTEIISMGKITLAIIFAKYHEMVLFLSSRW